MRTHGAVRGATAIGEECICVMPATTAGLDAELVHGNAAVATEASEAGVPYLAISGRVGYGGAAAALARLTEVARGVQTLKPAHTRRSGVMIS